MTVNAPLTPADVEALHRLFDRLEMHGDSKRKKRKSVPNPYLSVCPVCSGERARSEYRERNAFFTRYGWRMHMRVMHRVPLHKIGTAERVLLNHGQDHHRRR